MTLNPYISLGVLFCGGALALGLALYLFEWDSQNKMRRSSTALAALVLLPYVIGVVVSLLG